ncbi:MAG: hypothetical protein L6R42_009388 [Xanthoria sp. 1 TBL-2021]|nr:MAG: hypothetical protein L6R42_009388 [Xanthoria sp. 1 TBL-2021]
MDRFTEAEKAAEHSKRADRSAIKRRVKELRVSTEFLNADEDERKSMEARAALRVTEERIANGLHASVKAKKNSTSVTDQLLASVNAHDELMRNMMDRLSKQEELGRRLLAENKRLQDEISVLREASGLASHDSREENQGPDPFPELPEAPFPF